MDLALTKKLSAFFYAYPVRDYQRGQILIHNADVPKDVYFLHSGRARQFCISNEGNEVVVNVFRKHSFFPSFPMLLSNSPSDYFFDVMSDVKVRKAPLSEVLKYLRENPDLILGMLLQSQDMTEKILKRMSYIMSSNAYYRLAYELLLECQLGGYGSKGSYKIPMHSYELANQAGMSRETASRVLKKFRRKGLVKITRKYIIVKNIFKLRKELGSHI